MKQAVAKMADRHNIRCNYDRVYNRTLQDFYIFAAASFFVRICVNIRLKSNLFLAFLSKNNYNIVKYKENMDNLT